MDGNQNKCSNCGAAITSGDAFCTTCGSKVTGDAPVAETTGAVTPVGMEAVATEGSAPVSTGNAFENAAATPVSEAPKAEEAGSASIPAPSASAETAAPANTEPVFGSNIQLNDSPAPATTPEPQAGAPAAPAQNYGQPVAPSGFGASTPPATPTPTPTYNAPAPTPSYGAPAQTPPPATPYGGQPAQPGQAPGYGAQQPAAPYGAAPSYSAPGTPPPPGGVPPYGQQPAQPGQPGYNGYPQGGTPGFPAPGSKPPAKKKSPVVPIIIVLVLLVAIGIVAVLLVQNQQQKAVQAEYDAILTSITNAKSPSSVVSKASSLEDFVKANPSFSVDEDLLSLVEVCEEYEDASDGEDRYEDAISGLKSLEKSSVDKISSCAEKLRIYVEDDYEYYLASINIGSGSTDPGSSGGTGGTEGYSTAPPLEVVGEAELFVDDDGEPSFTFTSVNNSDKTVSYAELWAYCYDANGELVAPSNSMYVRWYTLKETYAPGETMTSNELGWYNINISGKDIAYVYIAFNYVEFSDGSTWGRYVTDAEMSNLPAEVKAYMDWVRTNMADPAAAANLSSYSFVSLQAEKNRYSMVAA